MSVNNFLVDMVMKKMDMNHDGQISKPELTH